MPNLENPESQETKEDNNLRELSPRLQEFLKGKNATIREYEDTIEGGIIKVITFTHKQELPVKLPHGYGYSGGVARVVALTELGEKVEPPRDLDIVGIEEFEPDYDLVDIISQEYMKEDFARKHGVKMDTIPDYFSTRDFVINEVLVVGDRLLATPKALEDLMDKVIRPTTYEQDYWYSHEFEEKGLHPKLVLKALRLQVEFAQLYGCGKLEGIEGWQFDTDAVPAFYIALQLNKAFERGDNMAFKFFNSLIEHGTVSTRYSPRHSNIKANSPEELAIALRWNLRNGKNGPFEFTIDRLNETKALEHYLRSHHFDDEEALSNLYENLTDAFYPKIKGMGSRERYYPKGSVTSIINDADHGRRSKNKESQEFADRNEEHEPDPYGTSMGHAFRNPKKLR
jgi:hypothetical protein